MFFSSPQQRGLEADHLLPSHAKVKNEWSYTSLWRGQGKLYVCRRKMLSILVPRTQMCLMYQPGMISEYGALVE
jgi:hypothetical protein